MHTLLKYLAFLKLAFVFLVALLFLGCHNNPNPATNIETPANTPPQKNALKIYSESIHSITLPFVDTCYGTMTIQNPNLPDSISMFKIYGEVVGKVAETKQYVAILYSIPADVQLPVLHTFNTKGEKISSLKLFIGNCCGEDEGCSGLSTVRITKDLHIILKDSMQTFERSKRKSDKKRNIQILKKYEEFKIDSTGKIIKVTSSGLNS